MHAYEIHIMNKTEKNQYLINSISLQKLSQELYTVFNGNVILVKIKSGM